MLKLRNFFRPLLVLAALGVLAVSASACGSEHESLVEGEPVENGTLEYKVLFTRLLNIHDVEDRAYLEGKQPPPPGKSYLGVFVSIENVSDDETAKVPEDFKVVDTDKNTFSPLPSDSIYALRLGGEIGPGDVVPALDSTAQVGPIAGSMLLFEITDSSMENRPLELVIPHPEHEKRVVLDM
jgi:hypothetical protein